MAMQNSGQGRPPIGRVFNPGNIPTDLEALRRWAPWKAIWNETRGKWDKVPYRRGLRPIEHAARPLGQL
jgi:hypothetical protein